MRIAMAGNPNSGKTTMFNALTGRSERIGNWVGVTVEKKEYPIKKSFYEGEEQLIAVDLPGAYSMSPFTSEENITSSYVKKEHPDVLLNIVDAANLSRSLFFTTQLLELGIPMIVALNKSDINLKKNIRIDEKILAKKLGCPVVKTISTAADGLEEVVKIAVSLAGKTQKAPYTQKEIHLTNKKEVEEADRKRFAFVNEIVAAVEVREIPTSEKSIDDAIDAYLTHPVLGVGIFAVVMWGVFYLSQSTIGTWLSELLASQIEKIQNLAAVQLEQASPILQAVIVDGIIGGVGAVVGFLPLVMVMYFLIALLEDCGYMARVAVVLDPIFKRVGLSGKSVIPMVIGTGCGVPAVMACRTIKNERERRATAMLCTFMPCGAKLPVIALFAGAFFPNAVWIGPVMYFVGIGLILLGAVIIKYITGMKYRKSFFIMELPQYKIPSLFFALKSMMDRGKAYVVKAGTIILLCNTVVQVMSGFTLDFVPAAENSSDSILAVISSPFAVLLVPLIGFACWQCAAAAITGFIAKENVVGTLATVYSITNFIDTEELALISDGSQVAAVMGMTQAAALAYLIFNLFTPPCFAALGAMNAEMKSTKWMAGAIGFQLATGYIAGFVVYQAGTLLTTGSVGAGFIEGLIAVFAIAAVIVSLCIRSNHKVRKEYLLGGKV